VELVVEQVAGTHQNIRDQGGKVVVTAGPVVIHTGGGEHGASGSAGYVQALLSGNASLSTTLSKIWTSLSVDMQRGVAVKVNLSPPSQSD